MNQPPERPVTTTGDEASAIAAIGGALDALDRPSRLRVLDLIIDRYYKPLDTHPG